MNGVLRKLKRRWEGNLQRLDAYGYKGGPMVGIKLEGDKVTITERRVGVAVGTVPASLEDPWNGGICDLQDPRLALDEGALRRWILLAWYYLTGESVEPD